MTESSDTPGHEPAITAPLSRYLVVADPARSIAFYRDVLGFAVHPVGGNYGQAAVAELVRGPARIQLGIGDGEAGTSGPAILFFETDDVDALRAAVAARGGSPSALERVNWIKMRMFELRDPDGHTLWFGQSFHKPAPTTAPDRYIDLHTPAGHGQLRHAIPELPCNDVAAAVAHYRDVLGFRINYAQDDIGIMDRDSVTVALIARSERHRGIGSCYMYVRDADALHAELRSRGANVQGGPVSMPWGLRQFRVLDPDGNQITFGQTFE
jgi:catechol 2,3-dioxygenase-like lactoylglutathione lyase family enzyme